MEISANGITEGALPNVTSSSNHNKPAVPSGENVQWNSLLNDNIHGSLCTSKRISDSVINHCEDDILNLNSTAKRFWSKSKDNKNVHSRSGSDATFGFHYWKDKLPDISNEIRYIFQKESCCKCISLTSVHSREGERLNSNYFEGSNSQKSNLNLEIVQRNGEYGTPISQSTLICSCELNECNKPCLCLSYSDVNKLSNASLPCDQNVCSNCINHFSFNGDRTSSVSTENILPVKCLPNDINLEASSISECNLNNSDTPSKYISLKHFSKEKRNDSQNGFSNQPINQNNLVSSPKYSPSSPSRLKNFSLPNVSPPYYEGNFTTEEESRPARVNRSSSVIEYSRLICPRPYSFENYFTSRKPLSPFSAPCSPIHSKSFSQSLFSYDSSFSISSASPEGSNSNLDIKILSSENTTNENTLKEADSLTYSSLENININDKMGNIQGSEGKKGKGDKRDKKAKGKLGKSKSTSKTKLQSSREILEGNESEPATPSELLKENFNLKGKQQKKSKGKISKEEFQEITNLSHESIASSSSDSFTEALSRVAPVSAVSETKDESKSLFTPSVPSLLDDNLEYSSEIGNKIFDVQNNGKCSNVEGSLFNEIENSLREQTNNLNFTLVTDEKYLEKTVCEENASKKTEKDSEEGETKGGESGGDNSPQVKPSPESSTPLKLTELEQVEFSLSGASEGEKAVTSSKSGVTDKIENKSISNDDTEVQIIEENSLNNKKYLYSRDDDRLPKIYTLRDDDVCHENNETVTDVDKLHDSDEQEYEIDSEETEDMPQASAGAKGGFKVSRHKKLELQPAKLEGGSRPSSSRNGGLSKLSLNKSQNEGLNNENETTLSPTAVGYTSPTVMSPTDSNVLQKVASLTLDRSKTSRKIVKPKFVPEKLDFKIYEKFEGQMLINWFINTFSEDHYLRHIITAQDLKLLATQFCTHLLAAGVIRQIEDPNAPLDLLFRGDLMYYWSHTESLPAHPDAPGKLTPTWPPPNLMDLVSSDRPGVKYTEAVEEIGGGTLGPDSLTETMSTDDVTLEAVSENDSSISAVLPSSLPVFPSHLVTNNEQPSSLDTIDLGKIEDEINDKTVDGESVSPEGEELQQIVMGLKREHRESLDSLQKDQEVSLFKLRGEQAEKLCSYEDKIIQLESEIEALKKVMENSQPQTSAASSSVITAATSTQTELLPMFKHADHASSIPYPIETPPPPPPPPIVSSQTPGAPVTTPPPPTPSPPLSISGNVPPPPPPPPFPLAGIPTPPPPPPPIQIVGVPPPPPLPLSFGIPPPPPLPTSVGVPPPPPLPPSGGVPPPPPLPCGVPPPPPLPCGVPPPPPLPCGVPPPPPLPGGVPPPPPLPGGVPPPPPFPGSLPPPFPSGVPPPPPCPGGVPPPPPPGGVPPPPPMLSGPTPFPPPPPGGWNASRPAELRKKPVNPKMAMKPLYWTRIQLKTPKPEKKEVPIIKEEAEATKEEKSEEETKEVTEEVEESSVKDSESEASSKEAKEQELKIREKIEGPLWDEIEEEEFDETEFVDLFARNVDPPKEKKKKTEIKVPKVKVLKVLDSKRSQNVGIFITSQHLDIVEVENAVYNFDTSTLDLEVLQQVYEVRGSQEEVEMIKVQQEMTPAMALDKPEQFLLDLSKINQFADRIYCFMFRATFEEELQTIHGRLSLLLETICKLMSEPSIKRVFSLILTFGNYMNGGNRQRGQADGFGLEILPKLKDVRSKTSNFTLLHFIVCKYIEKYEGENAGTDKVRPPIPDPYSVERSSNVQFKDLESDLSNLEKNLKVCERRSEKVIKASDEIHLQPFKDRMEEFFTEANKDIEKESKTLDCCKHQFDLIMKYFDFNAKGKEVTPFDFFSVWAPFCNDFMTIWQKEQQNIIKKRMKESEEAVKKIKETKKDIVTKPVEKSGLKAKLRGRLKS